ncbi:hypothetical protein JL722_1484 [Aureococcus anophagefferens]|nr:hypothetical protein JL722_1484 [Aureococcus anophagefferens]
MVPRLCLLLATLARAAPEFPLQFRAVVETTAHLVDRAQDYPPWLRRVQLDYDYVNKRARAAVLLGLDAGKNFTRRYDAAQEYAVRGEPYPDCKRSYLGEAMPMPAYPSTAALAEADVDIDGSRHERWLVDIPGAERTHVYTNEALVDGAYVPLMTYDFVEFEAVAPAEAAFDLDAPWTKATCDRHARRRRPAAARDDPTTPSQVGGWPYLHLFHHYLMV